MSWKLFFLFFAVYQIIIIQYFIVDKLFSFSSFILYLCWLQILEKNVFWYFSWCNKVVYFFYIVQCIDENSWSFFNHLTKDLHPFDWQFDILHWKIKGFALKTIIQLVRSPCRHKLLLALSFCRLCLAHWYTFLFEQICLS